MALRETFANNTIKFENEIRKQKEEDARRFLATIAIPAAEKVSKTTSRRQFCISVPSTIDFDLVAEMLDADPYNFEVHIYSKEKTVLIKW